LDFQTWIEHTPIVNMLADPLTKDLAIGVFSKSCSSWVWLSLLMHQVSGNLKFTFYIIMVFMWCKFINNVIFITSLLAYKNVCIILGSHIYYVLFYFIYYPLFMKSMHMIRIAIGYYLCGSCLYFLIGICVCYNWYNLFIY